MADATITGGARLTLDCIACGAPFHHIQKGRGRYPRFCSDECRAKKTGRLLEPHRIICVVCGEEGQARKSNAKYCGPKCRTKAKTRRRGPWRHLPGAERACLHCERVYRPKRKTSGDGLKFCSRQCAAFHRSANAKGRAESPRASKVWPFICCACGTARIARRKGQRYCSAECYPKQQPVTRSISRACVVCGSSFNQDTKNGRPTVFCSDACAGEKAASLRRIARGRRKALLRAVRVEAVDPIKVFIRDGWRCHLCGCKTPRRLRGSFDDRAPELEHIVPLSQGGEHSYINTACACRRCNGLKGASTIGQLRLFG